MSLEKNKIRKDKLLLRAALSESLRTQLSEQILNNLLSLVILKQAKTIACYQAMRNEVKTDNLIKKLLQLNKLVQVPLVLSESEMIFEPYIGHATKRSLRKQLTTAKDNTNDVTLDVALVPAVAISRSGNRIGYGRGYYDRWLSKNPETRKIALVFDRQISDLIIPEKHDQIMDFVVTENEVICCKD